MQLRPLVVRDVSGKLTLSKRQSATKERTGAREFHLFLWSSRSCCSQGQKIVGGPTGGSVHVSPHAELCNAHHDTPPVFMGVLAVTLTLWAD